MAPISATVEMKSGGGAVGGDGARVTELKHMNLGHCTICPLSKPYQVFLQWDQNEMEFLTLL